MDTGLYGAEPANSQPVELDLSRCDAVGPAFTSSLASELDQWVEAGFGREVLPGIPPNAIVDDKLRPNAGKIPGRHVGGGRYVGFVRWSKHVATPQDHAEWRTWPDASLCIQTAALPAFDIDVDDPALAARMERAVLEKVGPGALVRRRAGSSRVAIFVRSSEPVSKKRGAFTLPGDARLHAVELLGVGQQAVVAGKHRSGSYYRVSAHRLDEWTDEDIPCLTAGDILALFKDLGLIAAEAGGQIAQPKPLSRAGQAGPDARLDPYNAVMRAVCRQRAKWAPFLFDCLAGPEEREWRRDAVELGREGILEEALCIYPHSIFDFGTERSHTPVSLIREFGHVEANGEITFGGSPEYGPKGKHAYAAIEGDASTVRRPTEAEAFAWLVDCLGGPAIPPGASRDVQMGCLAASVGLNWAALNAEDARGKAPLLCPLDANGDPLPSDGASLPEDDPAAWTPAEIAEHITRVVALRALHPAEHDRLQVARGLSDDDIAIPLELEDDRARKWDPNAPMTGAGAASISTSPEENPVFELLRPATGVVAFRTFTEAPDVSRIPLRQHVIAPWAPRGGVVMSIGGPGVGKSALGLHDLVVITSGREDILRGAEGLSPERLLKTGPGIGYDSEDTLDEMERRLAATMQHHRVGKLQHPLHLWSGVGAKPLWLARRNRDTKALEPGDGAAALLKAIVDTGAIYAVIGPFAGLAEGMNENDAADCNMVMQIAATIATKTGCCINIIHHTSKSGSGEAGDMNAARGSSAIVAAARAAVTVNMLSEEDARRYGLTAHNHFARHYAKVSHGQKPTHGIIYRRDSVPVGNGLGAASDPRDAFSLPAQDALRIEGDRAPVLTVVGVGSAVSREEVREQKRAVAADGVSADILKAVGGVGRWLLPDIMSDLVRQFQASQSIKAQMHSTVRDRLKDMFGGPGRTVEHDGQDVRIRTEKAGPKEKDPWMLVVEPTQEGMRDP